MRVSWETRFQLMQAAIENLQQQLARLQQQLATGQRLTSLADDPIAFGRARRLQEALQVTERHAELLQAMIEELQAVQTHTEALATTLEDIETLLTAALDPKNLDKPAFLAEQLRQRLEDVLRVANSAVDGRFLFSGTMTQLPDSGRPFELRHEEPSPDNPSGLTVVFRGNLAERRVALVPGQEEGVSLRADELFGSGGEELFAVLIAAYNLLAYRADGSQRPPEESLSAAERARLEALLPQLAAFRQGVDRATARAAVRQTRWELWRDQLQAYGAQLRSIRSDLEDADLARLALELQQTQTVLQAVLQTSARILGTSLFDFLR